jgi:aspartate/methionine/tyrosine aminotransferase
MGSGHKKLPGHAGRPAFWADRLTSVAGEQPENPAVSERALTALRHPQAFGNYFSYGAAAQVLGLDPRSPFADGSMRLRPGYSDFGYMWSQLGPPQGAMAALDFGPSAREIAEYPPDLSDDLRELVAVRKFGRQRDASFDVLGTEGAQGAVGYAFLAFLNPGDEVLVTDPGYMHFASGPCVAGATIRAVPLTAANGFRLDPDDVVARITPRTKMVVVCDPINPLGVVQERDELIAIAVACERRGILVLNNTTHATHRVNPLAQHVPMAALHGELSVDHVVSVTGLSKGYALAALRLGFMAGHPSLLRAAAHVRMEITGIHIHPFAQVAARAALCDDRYVAGGVEILRRNLAHLRKTLSDAGEVSFVVEPDYGFCACLDVGATGVSAQELTVALFRQGVCVIAGDAFGEQAATRYVRLNYSSPDLIDFERFREALPRAIRDAQSRCYLSGVEAFYRSKPSPQARTILAQLRCQGARRSAPTRSPAQVGTGTINLNDLSSGEPSSREKPMRNDRAPSFVSQLQLEYGPLDQLGKFFASAYSAALDYGVHVAFGSFAQLLEVNLANQASWRAIIPTFDPRYSDLDQDTAFCLLGYNAQGEVVATQACRLFTWTNSNFFEAAQNLRLFYANPERDKRPGEICDVTAESARAIGGRVAFSGGGWYRPDYRGKFLSLILPRISRAYAFSRWSSDYTASMFQDSVLAGGMAERCGYTNIDWHVHVKGSPMGDIKFAFVWMEPDELIRDLAGFDSLMAAQVHGRIRHRGAQ